MPDQKNEPIREDERPVDKAEGERNPGTPDNKVMHNPDQAEGDRETVEETLENKQGK